MQTQKRHKRGWAAGGACLLAVALAVTTAGCSFFESGSSSAGNSSGKPGAQKGGGSSGGANKVGGNEDKADKAGAGDESDESESSGALSESSSGETGSGTLIQEEARRRNPFAAAPEFRNQGQDESQADAIETSTQRGPLRRYSYEKYRLAGLISETAVPKAMFIAPDRVGHLVKPGDRIGKEGGVIEDIRNNTVELKLPAQGDEGRSRIVTVELRQAELPEEQQQQGLSKEERETLQRLLNSEEGRKAVRQSYQQGSGQSGGRQQ